MTSITLRRVAGQMISYVLLVLTCLCFSCVAFPAIAEEVDSGLHFCLAEEEIPMPCIFPLDSYEQQRINQLVSFNWDKSFGIDVSHYQEDINWNVLDSLNAETPIEFVIMRATFGTNGKDKKFWTNWKKAKERGKLRGAYHYYRPNEHSTYQITNFINRVKLEPGDLPPVLDIEGIPRRRFQSIRSLCIGLQRWLTKIEAHYGVTPIIYTTESFNRSYLGSVNFAKYPRWIANYNDIERPGMDNWIMWQFTNKGSVKGIYTDVDINMVNGNMDVLNRLVIQ